MTAKLKKGGAAFKGIKLLLCENPLPPIDETNEAARVELARSNYYTEPYSKPLRRPITSQLGVPERLIHINAGSELILRQILDRLGDQVHLLAPTYALFPEIARSWTAELAEQLQSLGARMFPTQTYFFLANFAPHDAGEIAVRLQQHDILIKPLGDPRLGPGYMRVTTAVPEDNARALAALRQVL